MKRYWMGVDGGGTSLRVVITDDDLREIARVQSSSANPSVIGHEVAAQHLQTQILAVLQQSGLDASAIHGAGVGIAGASAEHSRAWLDAALRPVLPETPLALASDLEIALVGAHGKREGILLLAGTGSAALGINKRGKSKKVGGWGYLISDGGSGVWMGRMALSAYTASSDGVIPSTPFLKAVEKALNLKKPHQLVALLYQQEKPPIAQIAALAPLVLEYAEKEDPIATQIVMGAADELASLVWAIRDQYGFRGLPTRFAGSLLQQPTMLRDMVADLIVIYEDDALHSPVIGAALLAKLNNKESNG